MNTVLLKRKDDQVTKMQKLCEEQIYIGVNKKRKHGKIYINSCTVHSCFGLMNNNAVGICK